MNALLDGTWTLLEARAWDAQGRPLNPPYGEQPMGSITFENGRMLAALCNADAALAGRHRSYSSYGGSYSFDGKTLEVLVDIASDTTRIGGRQVRQVELQGRRMTLRPPTRAYGDAPPEQRELVWERVAALPQRGNA